MLKSRVQVDSTSKLSLVSAIIYENTGKDSFSKSFISKV